MLNILRKKVFTVFLLLMSAHSGMSDTTITYDGLVYGKATQANTSYLMKPNAKTITTAQIREMALGCYVTAIGGVLRLSYVSL